MEDKFKDMYLQEMKENQELHDFLCDLEFDGYDVFKLWQKKEKQWDDLYENTWGKLRSEWDDKVIVEIKNGEIVNVIQWEDENHKNQ